MVGGDWILMATAKSPNNISVIKYWGKRNEELILAVNESIGFTLDPDHISATTTVAVSPAFTKDTLWLNGKEHSLANNRYQNCLRELRAQANEVEDKEKGIKITKEDWQKLKFHMTSVNSFPTACGLASSAAGFSCLVFAFSKLLNIGQQDRCRLSAIARLGSGSACRCLHGGIDKWVFGKDEEKGTDSFAIPLYNENYWKELVIMIAVVNGKPKDVSSKMGSIDCDNTSIFLKCRAREVVPKRIPLMEEAISKKNFATFARITCADSNNFHATCLDTTPPLFYMNDGSHAIINCIERWNYHAGTPQAAYTFDAGPNAFMFAPNRKTAGELLRRLFYFFPPPPDTDLKSFVAGDKTLLDVAGIHSMTDVENLPPPPEAKNGTVEARQPGVIKHFILSRNGRGPYLLDDSKSLLDPATGLPKFLAA